MARCEAFAYWACSTIKLAVARLTNKSKTIRAVRVLRECQDNEIAIQNCEYSTRSIGHPSLNVGIYISWTPS